MEKRMLKLSRYLAASAFALVITLGCFYMMEKVMAGGSYVPHPVTLPVIEFVDVNLPEQKLPAEIIRPQPRPERELPKPDTNIPFSMPELDFALDIADIPGAADGVTVLTATSVPGQPPAGRSDELAITVPIAPVYPVTAAIAGIEGWVKVKFTVTATGTVADVRVINSHPAGVFDDAARAAVRKWRFKPRQAGGQAVQAQAIQVIEFNLDSD